MIDEMGRKGGRIKLDKLAGESKDIKCKTDSRSNDLKNLGLRIFILRPSNSSWGTIITIFVFNAIKSKNPVDANIAFVFQEVMERALRFLMGHKIQRCSCEGTRR